MGKITRAAIKARRATRACVIRNKVLEALSNESNRPKHIEPLKTYCRFASKQIKHLAHRGLAKELCNQIAVSFLRNSVRINKKASGATLAKRK